MNKRCSICCELSPGGECHPRCCQKLFGTKIPPAIPYTWKSLNALAEKVVRQSVSVPGVQPKLSMHLEQPEKGVFPRRLTLVGMEGRFILKPPVAAYPEMPELEHLTMKMAVHFGIETALCGLSALEDGRWAFIARRMDRSRTGKLHMEDMCQLTDRMTEQKYRGSLEQVGRAILQHTSNPGLDAVRFFEVVLYCFLTGNADMHLKNFSLLREEDGMVRLSPAYDLLPTVLLMPEDPEESALTLNGKKRKLVRADFLALARVLKLHDKVVEHTFDKFLKQIPAAVAFVAKGFCAPSTKRAMGKLIKERAARLNPSTAIRNRK